MRIRIYALKGPWILCANLLLFLFREIVLDAKVPTDVLGALVLDMIGHLTTQKVKKLVDIQVIRRQNQTAHSMSVLYVVLHEASVEFLELLLGVVVTVFDLGPQLQVFLAVVDELLEYGALYVLNRHDGGVHGGVFVVVVEVLHRDELHSHGPLYFDDLIV